MPLIEGNARLRRPKRGAHESKLYNWIVKAPGSKLARGYREMAESKKKTRLKRANKPGTARPRRQLRVAHGEGKEALFQAVVRSVVRHGPNGISNRAVAKEAGVSHGLIRYHFGSREAMLTETYKWVLDTTLGDLQMLPGETGLAEWAVSLASMPEDEAAAHLFMNEMVLDACRLPERKPLVLPLFRKCFEAMEAALDAYRIPATPALARLIFATIVGMTLQHLVFSSPKLSRESALEFVRILDVLRDHSGK